MPHQILDDNFGQEKIEDKATLLNKEWQKIKFMLVFLLSGCLLLFVFLQSLYSEQIVDYAISCAKSGLFDENSFLVITIIYTFYLGIFFLFSIIVMLSVNQTVRILANKDFFESKEQLRKNEILLSILVLPIAFAIALLVMGFILGMVALVWTVVLGILELVYRLLFGGNWLYYKYEIEQCFCIVTPFYFYYIYYRWEKMIAEMQKKMNNE